LPWLEICVTVDREDAEAAEEALQMLGAISVTLEDEADSPVLEPDRGTTPLWPVVNLRGLFEAGADRHLLVAALNALPGGDRPNRIHWREVGDRDWARAWMDRFEPIRFGRRLWIVPGGMSIPPDPDNVELHLDPGLAFGTGTHPTTALCLEWLDAQPTVQGTVVDYGCGSGVLGIAALLLGAKQALCVDNDPQALEATAANAERNGVADRITCLPPESFAETGTDLVLANILAGPLVTLAPVLCGCAKPGAPIILSGILEDQADEVAVAYEPHCTQTDTATREGWSRLDFRKDPL
jgi:ribosomal protein L11 methyltransferase